MTSVTDGNSLRNKTLSGVGWTTTAQVCKQALGFVISVILVRLLTPQDFGLIGMITVFTGFAALFGELGYSAALIQMVRVEQRHYSSTFWLNLLTGITLMGIMMVAAPALAALYDEPRLTSLTMVISLNFAINPLSMVQRVILSRRLEFRPLVIAEVISLAVAGGVGVVLAATGFGVWSLVWQSLAASSVTALVLWMIVDWRPHLWFHRSAVAELLGFSANLLGFNAFNYWTRRADDLFAGKWIGIHELGIYTRAYDTMLLPVTQISNVVGRVMFPTLSRIQNDRQRVKRIYLRSLAMIALLTFPMMVGLLAVSENFVLALYGQKWTMVTGVLRILCLVGMVQSVVTTVGWVYQSQGRTDLMFRWGLFSGSITVAAFAVGAYLGTIKAIAGCYAFVVGLLLYWNMAIPGRLIGMSFSEVIRALAGIFGCAAAMALLVWGLGLLLPADWPHWAYLVMQVPTGVAIYAGLLHVFKVQAYQDVRTLALEQWRSRRNRRALPA